MRKRNKQLSSQFIVLLSCIVVSGCWDNSPEDSLMRILGGTKDEYANAKVYRSEGIDSVLIGRFDLPGETGRRGIIDRNGLLPKPRAIPMKLGGSPVWFSPPRSIGDGEVYERDDGRKSITVWFDYTGDLAYVESVVY